MQSLQFPFIALVDTTTKSFNMAEFHEVHVHNVLELEIDAGLASKADAELLGATPPYLQD